MKKASLYQRSGAFFVSGSFARRYRQMMRFIKKNMQIVCIFEKKVVTLQNNICMCVLVRAHDAENQSNKY